MNMDNPLVQRIMRGVALLDEHEPGWWDRIDLHTFHLPSMNQCILGQLYGSYNDGLDELGLPFGTGYGFNEPICYVQGQKLWVELIQERREAAVKQ